MGERVVRSGHLERQAASSWRRIRLPTEARVIDVYTVICGNCQRDDDEIIGFGPRGGHHPCLSEGNREILSGPIPSRLMSQRDRGSISVGEFYHGCAKCNGLVCK